MEKNERSLMLFLNGLWMLFCVAVCLFVWLRGHAAFESWREDMSPEEFLAKVEKMATSEQRRNFIVMQDLQIRDANELLRSYHVEICVVAAVSAAIGIMNVFFIYKLHSRNSNHALQPTPLSRSG